MSLARIALRTAVVLALRGRTLVGGNVLDSQIGVIEVGSAGAQTDQTKPFIAVYAGSGEADGGDLRGLVENGATWLTIEIGVTAAMAVVDDETDVSEIIPGIPVTDGALEDTLDLIWRDIANALTDPDNAWADIFRSLITGSSKKEVEPLRNGDQGQRLAARQIRLLVDLIDDPVAGEFPAEEGPLGPFLAALDQTDDPVAARQADLIRAAIGPADTADWRVTQRRRGISRSELLALGLGPVEQDLDRSTPEFDDASLEIAGSKQVTTETLGWMA